LSAPETATPLCPHFGVCGGCQHQDLAYSEQLRLKLTRLEEILHNAQILELPEATVHSGQPWAYRNRIRLRLEHSRNERFVGYNHSDSTEFLGITTCPIAAQVLWTAAEDLLAAAACDHDTAAWFDAASQVELFCNDDLSRVQLTLLCPKKTALQPASFARAIAALDMPQLAGAAAVQVEARTGRSLRTLAETGTSGLSYRVGDETYWVSRGSFFQINRFLLQTLVDVVCGGRSGELAWDLFAGVGLFSRVLTRSFTQVTAVEANPTAASDLRAALARLGAQHTAVEATTLDFLRSAVLQRDRPELIVLDPPRAGAGAEACTLLQRLAPHSIVYVSCDPATLARDLRTLQPHYRIAELHLVDLFPQTSHVETVVELQRNS
jgi:23S rRNA (uracil1939-C5)-methyltransferase